MVSLYGHILFLILLVGCASGARDSASKLRQLVQTKRFEQALLLTEKEKVYNEEQSKLLKLLEQGRIHHLKSDYQKSLQTLDAARELSDQLFTQSISKKIESAVTNDRADNYYGEKYERSLIRFYQALGHFILSQKAQVGERRRHLQAARAVILEWDSLLDDYAKQLAGQAVYKDDMLAKLFGALIHQQMGSRSETGIARQLYRDAKELLLKNYSAYPSFNQKSKQFSENFEQFPQLGVEQVRRRFIAATPLAEQLSSYIDRRLEQLKKRPDPKRGQVHLVLGESTIHPKRAQKITFPIVLTALPFGISNRKDFASYVGRTLGLSGGLKPQISFELPILAASSNTHSRQLVVSLPSGERVRVETLALANPLSEIAHQTLNRQMAAIKTKTGLRVAGKHLAALASSYLAFRAAVKSGKPEILATLLSTGAYTLASHKIDQSERADLRHWVSLPRNIWMGTLDLPPGEYHLAVETAGQSRRLGVLQVHAGEKAFFFSHF